MKTGASAGEYFVGVGLMSYIPHHAVVRRVEYIVNGDRQFYHAKACAQMAEVVRGGVDTNQVSSKTMESKLCPGLYFVGEVLDVAGDLGGFNLHWAWASGRIAGENA